MDGKTTTTAQVRILKIKINVATGDSGERHMLEYAFQPAGNDVVQRTELDSYRAEMLNMLCSVDLDYQDC